MGGREKLEERIIILPLFFLVSVGSLGAGASSTQKNLVDPLTRNPYIALSNSTATNHFQNEYQYRHTSTKPSHHLPKSLLLSQSTSSSSSSSPSSFTDQEEVQALDNWTPSNYFADCKGRLKLSASRGFITDGASHYQTNLQCTWLIDVGRNDATIRIQIHQFNSECNYDYLYIFDGDSIYSPLVAAFSGDIKDFTPAFMSARLESMISSRAIYSNRTVTPSDMLPLQAISDSRPLEIKASSGKAFIYFHSDTAQSMPGFYLTYSVDSCPLDCSNRGECDHSTLECRCHSGYFGDGCQYPLCPNNCTSPENGVCEGNQYCLCNKGFRGVDCSIPTAQQTWRPVLDTNTRMVSRAFHQAAQVDGYMWVIGGKTLTLNNNVTALKYSIEDKKWTNLKLEGKVGYDHLPELSGHSVAVSGSKLYIYGGIAKNNSILNCLSILDTVSGTHNTIIQDKRSRPIDSELSLPLAVVGHSSNIIGSIMYVFFGFNPIYGYINTVQKYNITDGSWSLTVRRGSLIGGSIGHSSTYDPIERLIYIFGGHHSSDQLNRLFSFDLQSEHWTQLESSPMPRYYHSGLIIGRKLVIIAGSNYNLSHRSDQCFSPKYMIYDLSCTNTLTTGRSDETDIIHQTSCKRRCWKSIDVAEQGVLKRHGQSIVMHGDELILFGGFNGLLMNDVQVLPIESCTNYTSEQDCTRSKLGYDCFWDGNSCRTVREQDIRNQTCFDSRTLSAFCVKRETCSECLNTYAGCVWCGFLDQCQYNKCKSPLSKTFSDPSSCYREEPLQNALLGSSLITNPMDLVTNQNPDDELECKRIENCYLCNSKPHCSWHSPDTCSYGSSGLLPQPVASLPSTQEDFAESSVSNRSLSTNSSSSRALQLYDPFSREMLAALTSSILDQSYNHSCDAPCYLRRSCLDCTASKCIWCSTSEQCMDSTAYFAYHGIGQCKHYVAHTARCSVASCQDIQSCDKCLANPACGWLNDISNTGKGRCIEGTSSGPRFDLPANSNETAAITGIADTLSNWHYTSCPTCQCNGHSHCKPGTGTCIQPCSHDTEGLHCDKCKNGHFGDPINGGKCWPCQCSNLASACNRETGKCYCSTKGMVGTHCNRCDDQNHYIGNPEKNGTCFYTLTTDYQYTFNMSKPDDQYYTKINFVNAPSRKDSDVDFTIACSRLALVTIYGSMNSRKPIYNAQECGSFRLRFPHERHLQANSNESFFVHVYNFQTPFIVQIAFTQHRTLYLPQFFFTFSSAFLFFFAVSGVVYKIKHEYDLYVRRQRQFIEMEQMASRPFSTVLLEVSKQPDGDSNYKIAKKLKEPTPISFEPCFGSNVGVLSLFVQLPGKPGLAIGSALISLNDDLGASCEDDSSTKRLEKEHTSIQSL